MKQLRCAIYDRVSTDLQVQTGLSLDTQKELLTEYALLKNFTIIDYYIDEGLSARKKLQNRKNFMRLLNDVKQNKIDLILVTKLDRWFRNVKDYHNTQAILEQHNCNWKTVLEDYDTSTADGQLKINIMLAVAQNESDRTSERIKVVLKHKKRKGEHITGSAPYGYILVDKKLQKDPSTKHIVEDLFKHYFTCFSKRQAIDYIQNQYGAKAPSIYQASRILKNETYAGAYQENTHFCEPYISYTQLELIQQISTSKIHPSTHQVYLFSQLIVCPLCGAHFSGFVKKQPLKDGSISIYKRYRCSNKVRQISHKSGGACITESVIEAYMLEHTFPELNSILYNIREYKRKSNPKNNHKKIESELHRLTYLFLKGRISEAYYNSEYLTLKQRLEQELEDTACASKEDVAYTPKDFSGTWKDIYSHLDEFHKRAFWKRTIKEINIDPDTHKICGFKFLI